MQKTVLLIISILVGITINAQKKKIQADTCSNGIFWAQYKAEKYQKDSILITAYVRVVGDEIRRPDPFAAIYVNDRKIVVDKDGKVTVVLPEGDYYFSAYSGEAHPLQTKKYHLNGGANLVFTFYLKAYDLY